MVKKIRFFCIIVVGAIIVLTGFRKSESAFFKSAAAPEGYTGSPGDGKDCTKCHSGAKSIDIDRVISSDIPSGGYEPGKKYTITTTFKRLGHVELGFQVSPQNKDGDIIGTLSPVGSDTKLVGDNKGYITHTSGSISAPNGEKKWIFNWTAPKKNTGDLVFYGAFNATNNNNKSSGDSIFLSKLSIKENITLGVDEHNRNSFATFNIFPNPIADNLNITYHLRENSLVKISIHDINGRLVENLSETIEASGKYQKTFNLNEMNYPGGMYFVHLNIGGRLSVKQILKSS